MPEVRDTRFIQFARTSYRAIRAAYRSGRAVKNSLLNRLDPPVVILVYHRVAELRSDPEMLAVTPRNFRQQMEVLRRQHRIVRLEEDWSGLDEPAVAVTFDDGYADNFEEALPILQAVGVPATFFVSTGRIGTDSEFWWHQLERILLREGEFPAAFKLKDSRYGRTWPTSTLSQRRRLYDAINLRMRQVAPEHREIWLEQLRGWSQCGGGEGCHRLMTADEVRRLAASPWATVGAHTVTHSALSALTEEEQREEIFTSRRELERITGTQVTTFSYPFGRKQDYDQTSIRLCREAGFVRAASNFPGQVHRWTDPFQLPRHLVRNWDADIFAAEMTNFWTR